MSIRIFLATTDDINSSEMKKSVQKISEELRNGNTWAIVITRDEVAAGSGKPHEIVRSKIEECDIFIGLVWFDLYDENEYSYLEKTFEIAHALAKTSHRPHIMIYTCVRAPADWSTLLKGNPKTLEFIDKVRTKHNYTTKEYQEIPDFETTIRNGLKQAIDEIINPPKQARQAKTQDEEKNDIWSGLELYYRTFDLRYSTETLLNNRVRLENIYVEPELSAWTYQLKFRDIRWNTRLEQPRTVQQSITYRELLDELEDTAQNKFQYVLLGPAGIGKTTLLKRFGLGLVKASKRIPVFLVLSAFAGYVEKNNKRQEMRGNADVLETYIHEVLLIDFENLELSDFRNTFKQHDSQIVLLFDGLDEISDTKLRKFIVESINEFAVRYPTSKFLLTSREAIYRDGTHLHCNAKEIKEFTTQQIKDYIKNISQFKREAKALLDLIRDNNTGPTQEEIISILRNPLLLKITIELDGFTIDDTYTKVSLFDQFADHLIKHRPQQRSQNVILYPDTVYEHLQQIAYDLHFEKAHEGIHKDKLYSSLKSVDRDLDNPRDVVTYLENEIGLIKSEGEKFNFVHYSFQEYFAARQLEADFRNNRQRVIDSLLRRVLNPTWHETIIMFYILTQDHTIALSFLESKDDIFVTRLKLVADCISASDPLLRKEESTILLDRLLDKLELYHDRKYFPIIFKEIINRIRNVNHKRVLRLLKEVIENSDVETALWALDIFVDNVDIAFLESVINNRALVEDIRVEAFNHMCRLDPNIAQNILFNIQQVEEHFFFVILDWSLEYPDDNIVKVLSNLLEDNEFQPQNTKVLVETLHILGSFSNSSRSYQTIVDIFEHAINEENSHIYVAIMNTCLIRLPSEFHDFAWQLMQSDKQFTIPVIRFLSRQSYEKITDYLADILDDDDTNKDLKIEAIKGLGYPRSDLAEIILIEHMGKTKDVDIRHVCIEVLSDFGEEKTTYALTQLLNSMMSDTYIRIEEKKLIIKALYQIYYRVNFQPTEQLCLILEKFLPECEILDEDFLRLTIRLLLNSYRNPQLHTHFIPNIIDQARQQERLAGVLFHLLLTSNSLEEFKPFEQLAQTYAQRSNTNRPIRQSALELLARKANYNETINRILRHALESEDHKLRLIALQHHNNLSNEKKQKHLLDLIETAQYIDLEKTLNLLSDCANEDALDFLLRLLTDETHHEKVYESIEHIVRRSDSPDNLLIQERFLIENI